MTPLSEKRSSEERAPRFARAAALDRQCRCRAPRFARAVALALSALAASAFAVAATAEASAAGGAAPFRPTDPEFVVAELPGGSRARDGFARQLQLSRSDPQLAAQLAAALLEQARVSAQPQLYGRAESVLASWIARPTVPAPLLILEANILQQRHEFAAAIELLDRAIAQDPRSSQAHLMRANVRIVTGDYERARPDCAWLLGSGEQWTGSVCIAQVLGSTGQLARARALLERLAAGDAVGPAAEVLAWALSVRADLAQRAGALPEAQDLLTRAVALAPASDYTRLALADVLIARDRLAEAVEVLDTARPSVGVLLRRAIAQSRTQAGYTPESLAALEERLAVSAQRGERTHLREETRLALEFPGGDAAADRQAVLALARDNFNVQRETEDIRLFARAAAITRDPAALATLEEWLQRSHYEDIVVDQLLRSGRSS
jgi:tetratricopeptide (TPR) repeat protein